MAGNPHVARQGIGNPGHAQLLLSEHRVPMYLEFFDAYIEAVTAVGRADLTRALQ